MSSELPPKSVLILSVQILLIVLTCATFSTVVALYVRPPPKQVVVQAERCGERITFYKILILKPDLDQNLARELATIIDEAARDFDRDADFVIALMYVESRFDPNAVSSVGAHGLMQVMPLWLKVLGAEGDDLFDPRVNVRRGLQIYGSYEGMLKTKELALTAYNRGSWRVEEDLRQDKDPRNGYAADVLDVYERLKLMQ
jgi:soluble lytic murein transglycosylase-like protein